MLKDLKSLEPVLDLQLEKNPLEKNLTISLLFFFKELLFLGLKSNSDTTIFVIKYLLAVRFFFFTDSNAVIYI